MTIHEILKKHWGYESFRPLQEDIILSVLEGKDTLGLMPTGGGKSITFQVPGLFFQDGITIVVTPLISLMKDQVDNLKRHGIKAVYFHSGMKPSENRITWEKIHNGKVSFIYIAPERLQNERFLLDLKQLKINLIVVDEAHCISQWGYDFRPSYLKIKRIREIKPGIPILALTATATPEVCKDIMLQLGFRTLNCFSKSFVRENISYLVRKNDSKIQELYHILSHTEGSAIVYVRSRKRCRELSDFLNTAGIKSTYYHAGLDFKDKEERQTDWKTGGTRVMVATNAFGMGIDKPDVRTVVHFDFPPSLEEYYQEAGRAGRDGKKAYAVLLVAQTDKGVLHRRVTEAFPERKIIKKTYERICNFLHFSIGEGYDKIKEFDIHKFCNTFDLAERQCKSSLRLLGQAGYMNFIEDPDSRSRLRIICKREELYELKGLSNEASKVLEVSLRLYPGLFSDYIFIYENEVSLNLKLDKEKIYESYLELARHKIISYIPKSGLPLIHLPTAREDISSLLIGKEIYEKRKDAMSLRIESILDYALKDNTCRVKRMLSYFGEKEAKDCGKCDICRNKKNKLNKVDKERALNQIIDFLTIRKNGANLRTIEQNCNIGKNNNIIELLNFMLNEGWLTYQNELYTLRNS